LEQIGFGKTDLGKNIFGQKTFFVFLLDAIASTD